MDASAQVSEVARGYDSGGHRAVGAIGSTVPPGKAGAVTDLSRSAKVTDTAGWPAVAGASVTRGTVVAPAARPDDRLDVSDAWCEALFVSWLQPSNAPTAARVAQAVSSAVRQFGVGGCAGRMAQEFGDHPEAAAERMLWVRRLGAARWAAGTGAAAPVALSTATVRPSRAMPWRRTCDGIGKNRVCSRGAAALRAVLVLTVWTLGSGLVALLAYRRHATRPGR